LISTNYSYSQKKIIKSRIKEYVLLYINESSNAQLNDIFNVYRTDILHDSIIIGNIKIVKFESGKCVAKIINEMSSFPIGKNDYIYLKQKPKEVEKKLENKVIIKEPEFKIIRRSKNNVVVKGNEQFDLEMYARYPIKTGSNKPGDQIGIVQILMYKNQKYGAKILSENQESLISVNDYLEPIPIVENEITGTNIDDREYKVSKKIDFIGNGSIITGICTAAFGSYFYYNATQTFTEYEAAKTANDAVRLYDETIQHDNKSKIGFAVGGGLVALGILYKIFRGKGNTIESKSAYKILPIQKRNTIGLTLQFALGKY